MNVAEASRRAITILSASPVAPVHDTPSLDVSVILAHQLGISRSSLLAHPETELDDGADDFFAAITLRATGLPVAYITGEKEFWGLPFSVTPSVLIPKPDTEILVERAIAIIGETALRHSERSNNAHDILPHPIRVLDACTGSGCIAVSLKFSCPSIEITATDISAEALAVARENAHTLLAPPNDVVTFHEGDLRCGLPHPPAGGGYDLIVSNPPYVPTAVTRELLRDGRGEPALALDGGDDGLDLVRALVDNVTDVLLPGGFLLVETGEYNAREAAEYLRTKGFQDILIHRDLENRDRVVEGRFS